MKHFIIALLFTIPLITFAQISTNWDETYGGADDDEANNIIQLHDGNLLVVGYTSSQGAGKNDGWVIKMSKTGEQIWDMTYGGIKDDVIYDAVELPNGNIGLAGSTESSGEGRTDFWFIMIDNEGNQKWDKTYGGNKDDEANQITLSEDGKIILTGYTKSRGAGNRDIWMIKIDQDGEGKDQGKEIWKRNAGGNRADYTGEVVQNPKDSALIVVGTTTSYGNGSGDMYLIRILNDRGRVKGKKYMGGKQYEMGTGVVLTDDDGYFIVGATMTNSAGLFDGWVTRINYEYDSYFVNTIGGDKDDYFTSVVKANENYLIAGYTSSKGEGDSDGWLIIMNDQGATIYETTIGESESEKINKIIKAEDGSYYFCGSTTSRGEGKTDYWVVNIKLDK